MRSLSIPRKGFESRITVQVDWGSGPVSYDPIAVGAIDAQDTAQVSVILSDSNGAIKAILDSTDAQERPARILQNDVVLFAGKVTSPITWSEADRTVSFDILTALDDDEFGFSAEEGEFQFVPSELVGKAWPVVFGTVLDYPALRMNRAVTGTTLSGVGILSGADLQKAVPIGGTDCGRGMSLAMMAEQCSLYSVAATRWQNVDGDRSAAYRAQVNDLLRQMTAAVDQQVNQEACGTTTRNGVLTEAEKGLGSNPVRILGGEDFPQDTPIVLNIGGGQFTGKMHGDSFDILGRSHADDEERAQAAFDSIQTCETPTTMQPFDMAVETPSGTYRRHGFIVCETPSASRPSVQQVAQHRWFEPGTRVSMASDEAIHYVASITPGMVLAVKAYKTIGGKETLVNVPNDLWRVRTQQFGAITATVVETVRPLSTIADQNWSDDLYLTFQSSVGPNTVDIIEWSLTNYSGLTADAESFAYVRAKVDPFPMNFPVLDRRNTLDLMKDMAWQARCALWVSNGVVNLRYLPEEPESDQTITLSDIEVGSLALTLTPTEDIITKMVATWRLNWADEPSRIVLRSNNRSLREESKDFFAFNQPDIVHKVATFWLHRKSHAWKRVKLRGFLNLLNLEPFDTVTLSLPGFASAGPIKAVVETVTYDSENYTVDLELALPVKAGSMELDPFYWSAEAVGDFKTTVLDTGVTGTLPIGFIPWEGGDGEIWAGGVNVVHGRRTDRGDRRLTDVGFVAQAVLPENTYAEVRNVTNPNPNLRLNYLDKPKPIQVPPISKGGLTIDIRRTKVIDSSKASNHPAARLDSIFREVDNDGRLVLADSILVGDGDNEGEFTFAFDTEAGAFAAGLAFLAD